MSFSNFGEEQALAAVLNGSFIGLTTSAPGETSAGSEVSASEYSRQSWTASYTQGDPTTATNTATVTFPQATSAWGTVTHAVLFSAATGGDYLGYMELRDPNNTSVALPKSVTSGDILRFLGSSLDFEIS